MTRTIGGRLTYRALAELHRPVERQLVEREIRRLASNGLKARDIAHALKLSAETVMDVLDAQAPQTPPPPRATWPAGLTATPTPPASAAATHAVGRLHASGATPKAIGAELGLSVATVLSLLARIAIEEPAP